MNEPSFIRSYMDLSACSEAEARSAFMYACCREDVAGGDDEGDIMWRRVLLDPFRPRAEGDRKDN